LLSKYRELREGIENSQRKQSILSDSKINEALNKARSNDLFQRNHIDAMKIDEKWKIWLNSAKKIIGITVNK